MTQEPSTTQRGVLQVGESTTVDVRPRGARERGAAPREVNLKQDPALGVLLLEERFTDEGEIARGGMGAIHRVFERTLNRTVAMKVLTPDRAHDAKVRQRFLGEAQVTGQLSHPNIVPVYELGADDAGKLFFTMNLVEGVSFSELLHDHPPQTDEDIERALEIFFRVCDALSFAHSRGVVHRDVKPANIMVGEHGQVYLMDWGIAKVGAAAPRPSEGQAVGGAGQRRFTTTLSVLPSDDGGLVLGTYAYMAPEQALGKTDAIDPRTDVFMLGAVLYRVVVGRPPVSGKTALEALANAAEARFPDARNEVEGMLRRSLLEVALQAMQRDPAQRFQNVQALKQAAQQVLRGHVRFPVHHAAPGELILREGEPGDDAFFIRTGHCEVSTVQNGVKVVLRALGPGEVFGETAVFTGQPRNASVQALDAVDLIVVPGKFITGALGLDTWAGGFVRSLGRRFTEGSRAVAEHGRARLRAEVAAQAWRLLARAGAIGPDGVPVAPLDQLLAALADRPSLDVSQVELLLVEVGLRIETRWGGIRYVVGA
jgi:eukaryotic-like serine/threonine-protein kinase